MKKINQSHSNESIGNTPARRWCDGEFRDFEDCLAVEEPLEIRLGGRRFTVTMRTPGHDEELAAGFLLAEGFVETAEEISEIRRPAKGRGASEGNVIDVRLRVASERLRERLKRNFVVSASCGVCGKTSIESIERRIEPIESPLRVSAAILPGLPAKMREAQAVFSATGGLHAAALFDVPAAHDGGSVRAHNGALARDGTSLACLREDVGRHNAVDKVIGRALMDEKTPLANAILMVSGRLSFEIVQKTASAGIPILCAVSAPSSLAVELADRLGITAVGFLRENAFNIYTHPERIS